MVNLLLILFSILDFIVVISLIWILPENIMLWASILIIIKGTYSIITSFNNGFYTDFMGIIDFISGVLLLIIIFGVLFEFSWIVGIILGIKGFYTIISSFN